MKNPFADPNHPLDYGIRGADVDLTKPVPTPAIPPVITPPVISSGMLTLDDMAEDGGKNRTQNQWFEYWKDIKDGRRFASMADMYTVFTQLKTASTSGVAQQRERAATLVSSLQQDWQNPWQVTSTRIIYTPDNLNAKIIHNYGTVGLQREISLDIPIYEGIPLADNMRDAKCVKYLQALFGTADRIETIAAVLEYVSGKPRAEIKLWTPPLTSTKRLTREQQQERAAWFSLRSDVFRVVGLHVGDDLGRSRGVRS